MSLLTLPPELRWQIFDWLFPVAILDHETRRQLYKTSLPHINRQLRYEAFDYYGRTRDFEVQTYTFGHEAVDPRVEVALLNRARRVRFVVQQPVSLLSRDGKADFQISMGMAAVLVIKSVCERLGKAEDIKISIKMRLGGARAEPVRVNLAGLAGKYCPPNTNVIVEAPDPAVVGYTAEDVDVAVRNCQARIQAMLVERLAGGISTLSLITEDGHTGV